MNHLNKAVESGISFIDGRWAIYDALTDQFVGDAGTLAVTLNPFEGRAFRLTGT